MGDARQSWRTNNEGRIYKNGVGDEGLWRNIVNLAGQKRKNCEIARELKCSPGLVTKVLKKHTEEANPTPHKNGGNGVRPHLIRNYLDVVQNMVDNGTEVKHLGGKLTEEIGVTFHSSTIYRLVGKDLNKSLQKGRKVDPRKYSDENVEYYLDYLYFQRNLSVDDAFGLKTYDECNVAVTGNFCGV